MQLMVIRTVTYNDIGDLEPLHIRSELKTAEPDWKGLVKGMWTSKAVKGLSLLAGYAAGEAYSMYAVFEAPHFDASDCLSNGANAFSSSGIREVS